MRTEKQIQASRANGARSHGPVTPQGKRNSARNSTRHGLLAATVVLEEEAEDRFLALLAEYMDEHQPRTATEISLVETMAVARWRLLRVWGAQKTALDRDIALQDANLGPASVRAVFALRASPESACPPEVLLRYEAAFDRQFSRALTRLLALRSKPAARSVAPYFPEVPSGQTWNEDSSTAKRTQEAVENEDPPPGISSGSGSALFSPWRHSYGPAASGQPKRATGVRDAVAMRNPQSGPQCRVAPRTAIRLIYC